MFHVSESPRGRGFQLLLVGLGLLSVATFAVTVWIFLDVRREQSIVMNLIDHASTDELAGIRELAGDLRWQFWLSLLLLAEAIAATVARVVLVRAYIGIERSLREVKVLATDILASMDQGVVTTDQSGAISSINPCGRQLLGSDPEAKQEWIGERFLATDDRYAPLDEICRHVLKYDDVVRDQDFAVEIDGHIRTLRCGCTLLRDDRFRKLGTVLQIRDVSEQLLIQQRMLRMERHMGLGALAAGLQHEIKNPLSALSLHVQLLDEQLQRENATPEIQEMLTVLKTEVARITGVLEGFRNYASLSELGRTKVDVAGLVNKLVRLVGLQAEQQGVKLLVDLPKAPMSQVELDSIRFEQVLLNLTVNALQAMPTGGTLTIRLRQIKDQMQLEVVDTGKGIPRDLQKRVFDPYFTTRSGGTGMGLALCDKIVRQHNGTIDFESGPSGTTFTVTIPLEIAE